MNWSLIVQNLASKRAIITVAGIYYLSDIGIKCPEQSIICAYLIAGLSFTYMVCQVFTDIFIKDVENQEISK